MAGNHLWTYEKYVVANIFIVDWRPTVASLTIKCKVDSSFGFNRLWYMTISYNDIDNNKEAYFYTDFKMVRLDGSSLHKHFIKNFKSTNVIIEKGEITVNGCRHLLWKVFRL